MALQAYTIISEGYPPVLIPDDVQDEFVDSAASADGLRIRLALTKPPSFIPAQRVYNEYGIPIDAEMAAVVEIRKDETGAIGSWYKSLVQTTQASTSAKTPLEDTLLQQKTTSQPPPNVIPLPETPVPQRSKRKRDWFARTVVSTASSTSAPTTTLSDILARDPPPLPTDPPYKPKTFLALNPSNKGFAMLQKSGWEEGEGLGATVPRRSHRRRRSGPDEGDISCRPSAHAPLHDDNRFGEHSQYADSSEEEIVENRPRQSKGESSDTPISQQSTTPSSLPHTSHLTSQPLLTPIPVALKNDRLGLGLQKKRKMVTHTSVAMHEHVRQGEAARRHVEQMKMKNDHNKFGKGKRAFVRAYKKDVQQTNSLLEYMNT